MMMKRRLFSAMYQRVSCHFLLYFVVDTVKVNYDSITLQLDDSSCSVLYSDGPNEMLLLYMSQVITKNLMNSSKIHCTIP